MKNWVYITAGLIISFIIIVCKFIFAGTPELFKGGAFILDILLFNLSLAFISSTIFYFITVYLPRQRDSKNVHESIRMDVNGIIGGTKVVFNSLYRHGNIEPKYYEIKLADLNNICPNIKLKEKGPILPGYITYTDLNWAQYLSFYKDNQLNTISKILIYTPFLESKFIHLLSSISNSHYYTLCDEWIKNYNLAVEPDLTSFSDALYEYYKSVRSLEDYCKKNNIIDKTI